MSDHEMDILRAGWEAMFSEPWDGSQAVMMGAAWDAMRKASTPVGDDTVNYDELLTRQGREDLAATRDEEDTKEALSADLELVQTQLDEAHARVALLETLLSRAITYILDVAYDEDMRLLDKYARDDLDAFTDALNKPRITSRA